jgi:ceramide glucosyltransferase
MIAGAASLLRLASLAIATASLAYLLCGLIAALIWRRRRTATSRASFAPVTIFKPVCGDEPELERNLLSFCDQDYPADVEILVGARTADDPAIAVARRIQAARPDAAIRIITGAYAIGANQKVNTLARLDAEASHRLLVIADSDVRVGPTYLRHVTAPLADPAVGIVTCTYRGNPTPSIWSRLGALAVDDWYIASVRVALMFGSSAYCAGATMALRREVLDAAGGFEPLAPFLADDYQLGATIRGLGLRTVVSTYEPTLTTHEASPMALFDHELRWMRTIRTVQPLGHAFLFTTYALPMSLLAAPFLGAWASAPFLLALLLRLALHSAGRRRGASDAPLEGDARLGIGPLATMLIVRDFLSLAIWAASFLGRRVSWRQQALRVHPDGVLSGAD